MRPRGLTKKEVFDDLIYIELLSIGGWCVNENVRENTIDEVEPTTGSEKYPLINLGVETTPREPFR